MPGEKQIFDGVPPQRSVWSRDDPMPLSILKPKHYIGDVT